MCEPVSAGMAVTMITSAVMATGTAMMAHEQQRAQAKSANAAAEIQHNIDVERAKQEGMDRHNQLSQEALQESQRINQQRQSLALQALQEQASLKAASAEGGLGGVSKIRSFLSADIGEDLARSDVDINERNAQFNLSQNSRGIDTAQGNRVQNAFLTRQSKRKRLHGGADLAIGILGDSDVQKAIGTGVSTGYKAFTAAPAGSFQAGQQVKSRGFRNQKPQGIA